jgi:hypothetical protein
MTTQEMFEKRGYLVIASPCEYEVGHTFGEDDIKVKWAADVEQLGICRITQRTDRADWIAQIPGLPQYLFPELRFFYRVVAE